MIHLLQLLWLTASLTHTGGKQLAGSSMSHHETLIKMIPETYQRFLADHGILLEMQGLLSTAIRDTHCIELNLQLDTFLTEVVPPCSNLEDLDEFGQFFCNLTVEGQGEIRDTVKMHTAQFKAAVEESLPFVEVVKSVLQAAKDPHSEISFDGGAGALVVKGRRNRRSPMMVAAIAGVFALGAAAFGFASANRVEIERLDHQFNRYKAETENAFGKSVDEFLAMQKMFRNAEERIDILSDSLDSFKEASRISNILSDAKLKVCNTLLFKSAYSLT